MTTPDVNLVDEPDWASGIEVSYSFETAVQTTPYFVEQRRPLLDSPTRGVVCEFSGVDGRVVAARNKILSGASQVLCVPIYSEPIVPVSLTPGAGSIVASTDITYYWNIKHCSFVLLIDITTGASSRIPVSSVSGQTITLSGTVPSGFNASTTMVFPAIPSVVAGVKTSLRSDRAASVKAEFSEMEEGVEDTSEWIGFEDVNCLVRATVQGGDGNIDGYFMDSSSYYTLSGANVVGQFTSGVIMALQFNGVMWQRNAPINSAKVVMYGADNAPYPARVCNCYWRIKNVDNGCMPLYTFYGPSGFGGIAEYGNIFQSGLSGDYDGNARYESPELVSLVQAVVNRAGWAPGNNICFAVWYDPYTPANSYWSFCSNDYYLGNLEYRPKLVLR